MKSNHKAMLLSIGVLLFILVSLGGVVYEPRSSLGTSVSFLDIGQGDAIFVQTKNRKKVLIDAGPKDVVMQKLRDVMPRGDKTIDIILITNPDADHISGFNSVLDMYNVSVAIVPNTRNTAVTFKTLMRKLKDKNILTLVAYKDMKVVIDTDENGTDTTLTILFPDQVVKNWERNVGSIVSRIDYGDTSVMLMGDATTETEKLIIGDRLLWNNLESLKSDILKLGHHGSRTSTSEAWLDVVKPDIAIVSAGLNNSYGHPHQEVIDVLYERNIDIKQTSQTGTITFTSDGTGWIEK